MLAIDTGVSSYVLIGYGYFDTIRCRAVTTIVIFIITLLQGLPMNLKFAGIATLTLSLFTSLSHAASEDKGLHGQYSVLNGQVETIDVTEDRLFSPPEQLGSFSIVLKHADWSGLSEAEKEVTERKVKLKGILKGKINPLNFKARHVLTSSDRDYVLRSSDDVMIIESGDLFCSSGQPLHIKEYVNLVSGQGKYANLVTGTIALSGVIDNCPTSPTFGQNNLTVIPEESVVVMQ